MPRTLLDTGILLRLFDPFDKEHESIRTVLRMLQKNEHRLYTTTQNIAEFWNVSTRPVEARGGYGRSIATVERHVDFLAAHLDIVTDDRAAFAKWQELVTRHEVVGVAVHDARIAAIMLVRNIQHLVTLNKADFVRYENIVVQTPSELLAT